MLIEMKILSELEEILERLDKCVKECFYGSIEIHFQNGVLSFYKITETLKPGSLKNK